jgi:hypothetical protein
VKLSKKQIEQELAKYFIENKDFEVYDDKLMQDMGEILNIVPIDGEIQEIVEILRSWVFAGIIDCFENRSFGRFTVIYLDSLKDIMNGTY